MLLATIPTTGNEEDNPAGKQAEIVADNPMDLKSFLGL